MTAKRPKITSPIGRSVTEWIGKSNDDPIPDAVKWRVLLRFNRKCGISKRPIRPGTGFEVDHIKRLADGGEHRESNLQPVLAEHHARKTADENSRAAKADAAGKKAYGIAKPGKKMESRNDFPKSAKTPRIDKSVFPKLPYRNPLTGEIYK